MLLILPVFLTIVFTIMEMGNIAFWVILINHATYESARVGALWATRSDGTGPVPVDNKMQGIMDRFLPGGRIRSYAEPTLQDRQAGVMNHDLVVTGSYAVQLVFPMSSILLSTPLICPQGPGGGRCTMSTTVRVPIEQPLQQGDAKRGQV